MNDLNHLSCIIQYAHVAVSIQTEALLLQIGACVNGLGTVAYFVFRIMGLTIQVGSDEVTVQFFTPVVFTLAAFSGKRNVTVWCPSVRPSLCLSLCLFLLFLILTGRAAHTQRDSQEGAERDAASVRVRRGRTYLLNFNTRIYCAAVCGE